MLQVNEYVVMVEDEQGQKVSEFCFNRVEQAHWFMERYSLRQGETIILIERMDNADYEKEYEVRV
jgi:hypothetical protein